MPFASLLFLFLFFSITMFVYAYVGDIRRRNRVLIVSSLIFYFWASPKYLPVLLISTLIAWFVGKTMFNMQNRLRSLVFAFGIFLECMILIYFKWFNEILSADAYIGKYLLPVGISFYMIRLISYLIDVYRKKIYAANNFEEMLLYSSLFHLSIAAPMVRFGEIAPEFSRRKVNIPKIGRGVNRFTIGLFKVAVLAGICDSICRELLPMDGELLVKVPVLGLWIGAFAFMIQIYLAFSGYADMAIGMGRMIGFKYKENFDYPYMSTSIHEFCGKWYITFAEFLVDSIYHPLNRRFKGSAGHLFSLVICAITIALWCGRNWNGFALIIFYAVILWVERHFFTKKLEKSSILVRRVYTLIFIYFGWILFRFADVHTLLTMFKGMLGFNGNGFLSGGMISIRQLAALIVGCIACTSVMKNFYQWLCYQSKENKMIVYVRRAIEIAGPVVLTVLSVVALMNGDYTMFLYF